jgi:hypothetical protein
MALLCSSLAKRSVDDALAVNNEERSSLSLLLCVLSAHVLHPAFSPNGQLTNRLIQRLAKVTTGHMGFAPQ